MDYAFRWGGDPEDVSMTTSGVGELAEVEAMLRGAVADPRWREGMKVIIDHTRTDWSATTAAELEAHANWLIHGDLVIGHQLFAVAVKSPAEYAAERLIGFRLDRRVPFLVRYFSSHAEAREWLRRPDYLQAHVVPGRYRPIST